MLVVHEYALIAVVAYCELFFSAVFKGGGGGNKVEASRNRGSLDVKILHIISDLGWPFQGGMPCAPLLLYINSLLYVYIV